MGDGTNTPGTLTPQRVAELVLANRAIRSPAYRADRAGRQWGADLIPALMGLARVERHPRADRPRGWVGFARDPRGEALRLEFDVEPAADAADALLVVTAVAGRGNEPAIVDEDFGEVELPGELPTEQEWAARRRRYQAARKANPPDGAAEVRAYLAGLPGLKRAVATRIDEVIGREVPHVRREVKWHAPFYGVEARGWFAQFSAFSQYVRLTFFRGAALEPPPPVGFKDPDARGLDLREADALDDAQLAEWVRQAAAIPGWSP